ncbi:MAG TPA: prephenate dehydrogenase/arogenate dehydrogenase family protein, partial [Flavisolibacter sp.]|nr:prephenate dehydrogenase/arogenate dehydrogenase family protein [Flavisolibacter sp.]
MVVTVVGIGLIGGSMAIGLREKGLATKIIGVDADAGHQQKALQLGLVDEIMELESAVAASALVILAVPVNALLPLLKTVLNNVQGQAVMDVGST